VEYVPMTGASFEADPEEPLELPPGDGREVVLAPVAVLVLFDPPDDPPQPPASSATAAMAPRVSFFIDSSFVAGSKPTIPAVRETPVKAGCHLSFIFVPDTSRQRGCEY
jgi:hypothetical protein